MRVQMMGIMNRAVKIGDCLTESVEFNIYCICMCCIHGWENRLVCLILMDIQYWHANNDYASLLMLLKLLSRTVTLLSFKSRVSVVYKSDWPSVN